MLNSLMCLDKIKGKKGHHNLKVPIKEFLIRSQLVYHLPANSCSLNGP